MKKSLFLKNSGIFFRIILLFSLAFTSSCGKKEPTSSDDYTPKNVQVSYNSSRPTITWQTDQPTKGSLFYGNSAGDYNHFAYESDGLSRDHLLSIIAADSGTNYFFIVRSVDQHGISAHSEEKTFRPPGNSRQGLLEWTMLASRKELPSGIAITLRPRMDTR